MFGVRKRRPFRLSIVVLGMNHVLAMAEISTLGLLTLITGTSPPRSNRELFLPPLDLDINMPVPNPSSPALPAPIQTNLTTPLSSSSGKDSLPSSGPGAYDTRVIPPSHSARTLVLCFDGTGDQFDTDVRKYILSPSAHVLLADQVPFRIPISYSYFRC